MRLVLALVMAGWLALPASTHASQTVHLVAAFEPDHGVSSTISFGFTVTAPDGQVPSPLTGVNLHLPKGIGLARTALGTAVCDPSFLYAYGPDGCPADSRLGYGRAIAKVPYGTLAMSETAAIYAYRGKSVNNNVTVLFFGEAGTPVIADLVFRAEILEAPPPYGASLNTEVPLIPALPGGPNVSVVQFSSTFGPKHLVYERKVNRDIHHYTPRGVAVPTVCPAGGYPFAADVSFEDSSHLTATTTVPCPRGRRSSHKG